MASKVLVKRLKREFSVDVVKAPSVIWRPEVGIRSTDC